MLWLVVPSLVLFALLPRFLERGYDFYLSLVVSIAATIAAHGAAVLLVRGSAGRLEAVARRRRTFPTQAALPPGTDRRKRAVAQKGE